MAFRLLSPVIAAVFLMMPVSVAAAPEYLDAVTSDVYQTTGTASEIAARGSTCIARNLASGIEGGQIIIADDRASGVIVANNVVEYADGLLKWQIRSRFSFEAKDGRFRIQQTNIERLSDTHTQFDVRPDEWGPVGKWRFSGWQNAQAALVQVSDRVSRCVRLPAAAADTW